jgi:hypothetical protein
MSGRRGCTFISICFYYIIYRFSDDSPSRGSHACLLDVTLQENITASW